jgi:hypothetical protein
MLTICKMSTTWSLLEMMFLCHNFLYGFGSGEYSWLIELLINAINLQGYTLEIANHQQKNLLHY